MKKKTAVITGSSRGIGKAIAFCLAEKGFAIVLNGRSSARLKKTKEGLLKSHTNIEAVCCDVSKEDEAAFLICEALRFFGRIDVLVNNVGVSSRGSVSKLNPGVFRSVFSSNLMSAVNTTIPAIPELRKTKGSLVFISSLAGIRGLPFLAPYCSSKMALRAFAESIRVEEKNSFHVGLVYVGITQIEHNKEAVAADGSVLVLKNRKKNKVHSMEFVAKRVYKNISKRRFITTLSVIGKLNAFLSPRLPLLVERLIIKTLHRFEEKSK